MIFVEDQMNLIEPILSHLDMCLCNHNLVECKTINLNFFIIIIYNYKNYLFITLCVCFSVGESYMLICLLKAVCFRCMGCYQKAEFELFKIITK